MSSKHYHHRKHGFTVPLAVVAGFASPLSRAYGKYKSGGLIGPESALCEFTRTMIGLDPYATPVTFQPAYLRYGLLPIMLGLLVHKIAGAVGLNRALASAGIPVVRI